MPFAKWPIALLIPAIAGTAQSKRATTHWLRPSEADLFSPGDSIIGEWNTEEMILSPSFRLCKSPSNDTERTGHEGSENSNDCGSAMWPLVTQSAGSYSISLVAPITQSQDKYLLRMEDEFGSGYESPTFSLSPSQAFAATDSNPPVADLPQAPLGSRPAPEGNITQSDSHATGPVPGLPIPLLDNPISPTASRSAPGSPRSTNGFATPSAALAPNLLVARRTVAVAAYAVPLSVFAAILVIAGCLAVRHRYKLRQERRGNQEKLPISRQSSLDSKSGGDIEHALNSIPKEEAAHFVPTPVPLFMPAEAHIVTPQRPNRVPLQVSHHSTPPLPSPTKPPSTRSILSPTYRLPPIASSSTGFFDERDGVTHSVISGYFEPSPPVSPSHLPSIPKRLHLRDGTMTRRNHVDETLPHSRC